MKNIKRKILCTGLLVLTLIYTTAFSVSALNNGTKGIYSGETRIGGGQIWTNNSTTDRVLYGETKSTETQNSLVVRITYTYFDSDNFVKEAAPWKTASKAYATISNTEYAISETPIEARGQFAINSNIARICKMYNNGQGVKPCEDGDSCPYNN